MGSGFNCAKQFNSLDYKALKHDLLKLMTDSQGIHDESEAAHSGGKQISLADLIVLGGGVAVEVAAKDAGYPVAVPLTPGRMDASQEQTDVQSFAVLEPEAKGFRNNQQANLIWIDMMCANRTRP